jgi:hypothetical protein
MSGAFCVRLSVIDERKSTDRFHPRLWTGPQLGDFPACLGKRGVIIVDREMIGA